MARTGGRDQAIPGAGPAQRAASRLLSWLHEARAAPPPAQSVVKSSGAETAKPESIHARTAAGALFTHRGVGYGDTNEDAAVLGVLPSRPAKNGELVYAGAFDQAGGMGKARAVGAASAIAARRFEEAVKLAASGAEPLAAALEAAIAQAHEEVRGLGVNAATTFAAGALVDGTAVLVNTGDSAVVHYGADGRLKHQTLAHNFGEELARQTGNPNDGLPFSNQVTSAIGGRDPPWVDHYTWRVSPGDALVFLTDGVSDANLQAHKRDVKEGRPWARHNVDVTLEEVGRIVSGSGSAEAAASAVAVYALDNMQAHLGKPDNLAIVVLKVK